ncbi:hypothetical protein ACYSNU_09625 [Enterococcus sp. LJL120]
MLKKSANQGYILFEALISLLVVGVIIFTLLPQVVFLFEKTQTINQLVELYQVLDSETARNCRLEQVPTALEKEQVVYQIAKQGNQIRAEVEGYGQKIEIFRKF